MSRHNSYSKAEAVNVFARKIILSLRCVEYSIPSYWLRYHWVEIQICCCKADHTISELYIQVSKTDIKNFRLQYT
jgi:hypothetical protein